ncbi:MAG: MFS transporter [Acidimicrobiia bacterium]|nr:MFS transporter [Acidimicrobiia bacterium]
MATQPRTLTVNDLIDERPLSGFQLTTILLCGAVLLLDGFDTQALGFLVPPISEDLGIPLPAFGQVISAGLFGLMIGAMLAGPIADRWGRKWAIIVSSIIFGLFSLLTAFVSTLNGLILLRFLTGLGLGGAMPNVVALSSEYAPKRMQPTLVPAIFAGMGGGAVLASIVGGALIPAYGWRSVFVVGGVLPIALALILIKVLPESLRFLAAKGADRQRISGIVRKLAPEAADAPLAPPPASERLEGMALKHLFTEGRATGTLMLWIPFFMNLLILYFILSWLPSLLRQAGMPVSAGITAVAAFSFGGIVGTLIQGPLMKLMGVFPAMMTEFFGSLALILAASVMFANFQLLMVITFILGITVQGAQGGLNVLAAMYYPTSIRSTGVGWALGVGRIGSIVGPLIGGAMLGLQWTPQQIFQAGAVPATMAAAVVALSTVVMGRRSPYRPETAPAPSAAH